MATKPTRVHVDSSSITSELVKVSEKFSSMASALSDSITRFEDWLNTLDGKSEITKWFERPTLEIEKLGLWIHRREKRWHVSYRLVMSEPTKLRRRSDEVNAAPSLLKTFVSKTPSMEQLVRAQDVRHPGKALEYEIWDPLQSAPLYVKVLVAPLLPQLIKEMKDVQCQQVTQISIAIDALNELMGEHAAKEGR